MAEALRRRWENVPRTQFMIDLEKSRHTTIGRSGKTTDEVPFEITVPSIKARLVVRSVEVMFSSQVYLIDFYGSRMQLSATVQRLLAEVGFKDQIYDSDRIWHIANDRPSEDGKPCHYNLIDLRSKIATSDVTFVTARQCGLWIDSRTVMLLQKRTITEEVAHLIASHRESDNLKMDDHWFAESMIKKSPFLLGRSRCWSKPQIVFVVDTSLLLCKYDWLLSLYKSSCPGQPCSGFHVFLYLPWIVVKEIDALVLLERFDWVENQLICLSKIAHVAQNRLRELRDESMEPFAMETMVEFAESLKMETRRLTLRSPSSLIILSCLRLWRQLLERDPRHQRYVILLTDDAELMADATMNGIAGCSSNSLPSNMQDMTVLVERAVNSKQTTALGSDTLLCEQGFMDSSISSAFRPWESSPTGTIHNSLASLRVSTASRSLVSSPKLVAWVHNYCMEIEVIMRCYFGKALHFYLQCQYPSWSSRDQIAIRWNIETILRVMNCNRDRFPAEIADILAKLTYVTLAVMNPEANLLILQEYCHLCFSLLAAFPKALADIPSRIANRPRTAEEIDATTAWKFLIEGTTKLLGRCTFVDGLVYGTGIGLPLPGSCLSQSETVMDVRTSIWSVPNRSYYPESLCSEMKQKQTPPPPPMPQNAIPSIPRPQQNPILSSRQFGPRPPHFTVTTSLPHPSFLPALYSQSPAIHVQQCSIALPIPVPPQFPIPYTQPPTPPCVRPTTSSFSKNRSEMYLKSWRCP